jgi:NAD(P)-dependent dehydrogenase (short-subunit alcohol dehydrogenase family)
VRHGPCRVASPASVSAGQRSDSSAWKSLGQRLSSHLQPPTESAHGMAKEPNAKVLSGKIALVTGSTRGIGRGIAECMAEAGAHVIVTGRDASATETVSRQISDAGGQASPLVSDLADESEVGTLIARVLEKHGALDILVNNAGIDDERPVIEYSLESWRRILTINLEVPFRLCQAAAPHFFKKGSGVIINITSIFGLVGYATEGAYAAAKHGLTGLTKVLALEWSSKGVRVNAIAPGLIKTDLSKGMWQAENADSLISQFVPQGRIGQPQDIGGAAVFLASDAASFIQGETLAVDGGYLAR